MATALGVEVGAKYVITGPDGTRAVFNDPTDVDHVGFLDGDQGVTGLDGAEVRENSDEIVEGDGAIHGDFWLGRRPFTFSGLIDPVPRFPTEWTDVLTELYRQLVTNPSFETDITTDWSQSVSAGFTSAVITRDLSWSKRGAASARFAVQNGATGTARSALLVTPTGLLAAPVVSNETIVAIADLNVLSTSAPGNAAVQSRVRIAWYKADGTPSATTQTDGTVANGGATSVVGEQRLVMPVVVPADAVFASIRVGQVFTGTAPSNATIDTHFDGIMLVRGTSVEVPYFEGGDLLGGFPYRTAWLGTPNASASTYSLVNRTYIANAEITNRRIAKLRHAVGRARRDDCVVNWQTTGADPVRLAARSQQPLRIAGRMPKVFQVALVSADPLIVSDALNALSVNAAAGGSGGFGSPLRSPLTSTAAPSGQLIVTNDGTEDAMPLITLNGPMTNPTILNVTTGESMSLIYSLLVGEYLEVDTKNGTIKLNGTADRDYAFDFLSSVWLRLVPGANDLRLLTQSFSAPASMNVAWRDSWN